MAKRKKMAPSKPELNLPESFKHWQVTFEVTRLKIYDREESRDLGLQTAEQVEERAREEVLFSDEIPLDREEIGETRVRWVDQDGVTHEEKCSGFHCRHYDCKLNDIDYHEYCSQCDIDAY